MIGSRHYRLTRTASSGSVEVGGWHLETGSSLRTVHTEDEGGRPLGVMIGEPFDLLELEIAGDTLRFPFPYDGDPDAFVNRAMGGLGGHYLWIFDAGQGGPRIYPDPFAQVPIVYAPEYGVASSTDALLDEDEYAARFDRTRYTQFGVDNNGWFPAGMTAHSGVERLLPNHVLDLPDFAVARFWPGAPLSRRDDPDAVLDDLLQHITVQIEAIARSRPTVISLTAGQDTRLLLTGARRIAQDVQFVTVVGGDQHYVDSQLAQRLARFAGLDQREVQRQSATPEETEAFIRRTGHCVADANARYHPSVHQIARGTWFIIGLGGEVGRGFLWRAGDTEATRVEPSKLILRFGLPQDAELEKRLASWIQTAPDVNGLDLLDLAYIEHRMGPWAAAQFTGDDWLINYNPMVTRHAIECMLSLPSEWRREGTFSRRVIERGWPELLEIPINTLGALGDFRVKLSRIRKNPRSVLSKLRKMLG